MKTPLYGAAIILGVSLAVIINVPPYITKVIKDSDPESWEIKARRRVPCL
jgi:hypothetical protein